MARVRSKSRIWRSSEHCRRSSCKMLWAYNRVTLSRFPRNLSLQRHARRVTRTGKETKGRNSRHDSRKAGSRIGCRGRRDGRCRASVFWICGREISAERKRGYGPHRCFGSMACSARNNLAHSQEPFLALNAPAPTRPNDPLSPIANLRKIPFEFVYGFKKPSMQSLFGEVQAKSCDFFRIYFGWQCQ